MEDYSKILTRGLESDLSNVPIEDGKLRYATDTGRVFLDILNGTTPTRITISDIIQGFTEDEIKAIIAPLPKFYQASDTNHLFIFSNDTGWYDLTKLYLAEDNRNVDQNIWFSTLDSNNPDQPKYNTSLLYNPFTKTLKVDNIVSKDSQQVGDLVITTSTKENGQKVVDFNFAQ